MQAHALRCGKNYENYGDSDEKRWSVIHTLAVGLIGIPISALAIDAEDIIKGMETRGYRYQKNQRHCLEIL